MMSGIEAFAYEHWLWIVLGAIAAYQLVEWVFYRTAFSEAAIYRQFGLNPREWRLVSCDMGGESGQSLRGHGLIGTPDAIFRSRSGKSRVVVGEYKGRKARGKARTVEMYQLQMYLGLVKTKYPHVRAEGRLAYKDGVIEVSPCRDTFLALVDLAPEYRRSKKKGRAMNKRPLAKRKGFKLAA